MEQQPINPDGTSTWPAKRGVILIAAAGNAGGNGNDALDVYHSARWARASAATPRSSPE